MVESNFIIRQPKNGYFKSNLMLCHCSKLKVVHQNQQYVCVHMGTAVFVSRCWPWPLLNHGVRRLNIQHVSPLLPYLPILRLLTSPTEPHFYSTLLWCNIFVLYLLASMLYFVQSKTLFEQNETYATFSLSPTRTIPAPSDYAVFKILFKSNPL